MSGARPPRRPGRAVRVLVAGVVVWVGSVMVGATLASTPAIADPVADCSTTSGVIVAVDLRPWGGGIERGCEGTLTPATTGYEALQAAGFTPAGDEQDGPAFMCRIDGYPTEAQDPCVTTPPSTAYWSYWHADAGQDTWTYSQYGAMSYHPPPGSVDAWSFGSDSQPSFPPSLVMATNVDPVGTTTTTTATSPTAPGSSATTTTTATGRAGTPTTTTPASGAHGVSGPSGTSRSATTTTTSATAATTTSVPPTLPTTAAGTRGAGSSSTTTPKVVEASPVLARHRPSAGSPFALVVGLLVVAALALSGGFIVRRRRRTG